MRVMKDHRLRLIEKKPKDPKKEHFTICDDCRQQMKSEWKITFYWWAKSECSICGRLGSDLYKIGKGLVVATKEKRLPSPL